MAKDRRSQILLSLFLGLAGCSASLRQPPDADARLFPMQYTGTISTLGASCPNEPVIDAQMTTDSTISLRLIGSIYEWYLPPASCAVELYEEDSRPVPTRSKSDFSVEFFPQ